MNWRPDLVFFDRCGARRATLSDLAVFWDHAMRRSPVNSQHFATVARMLPDLAAIARRGAA
jgi:hypothetical protein